MLLVFSLRRGYEEEEQSIPKCNSSKTSYLKDKLI